jgi:hypothetical protein
MKSKKGIIPLIPIVWGVIVVAGLFGISSVMNASKPVTATPSVISPWMYFIGGLIIAIFIMKAK